MRFKPIVEGYGEVNAAPELLRRLGYEAGAYGLTALSSIKAHRTDFEDEPKLRKLIGLARLERPDAILLLFDADDDCPVDVATRVATVAKAAAHPIPCEVVVASKEYEAWFLASAESLQGVRGIRDGATFQGDPEEPRDAKGHVTRLMVAGQKYSPTADQTALTAMFDMAQAYARCRSFRRMVSAMGQLLQSAGHVPAQWPPAGW